MKEQVQYKDKDAYLLVEFQIYVLFRILVEAATKYKQK